MAAEALDLIARIRLRPGMYLGGTDGRGLHHLAYMMLDFALGTAGPRDVTEVVLSLGGSNALMLEDNGAPPSPEVLAAAAAGEEDGGLAERWTLTTVLALSSGYVVEAWSERAHLAWRGRQGRRVAQGPPPAGERLAAEGRGTRITLTPEPGIFEDVTWDARRLLLRLRELAPLFPRIRFTFRSPRKRPVKVAYPGGVAQRVKELSESREPMHPEPLVVEASWEDMTVRAALQWTWKKGNVSSFANTVTTRLYGSHVEAIFDALCIALEVERPRPFLRSSLAEGLVAIIACDAPARRLEIAGPTREVLDVDGLREGVREALVTQFMLALERAGVSSDLRASARGEERS